MSENKRERAIREKRTIEAVRKNIMGPAGKFGVIARYLGDPIKYQGAGLGDSRSIDDITGETYDVYGNQDPNALPIFNEDNSFIGLEGYLFDGLSRGIHLEIKYLIDTNQLTVSYKGYKVYVEVAGDLYAYAPYDEWEDVVNRLYVQASKKAEQYKKTERTQMEVEANIKKANFLQKLRLRWGV